MTVAFVRNRTTGDEKVFIAAEKSDQSRILLRADPDSLVAPADFSIELTLGDKWSLGFADQLAMYDIEQHDGKKQVKIKPARSIVIEVKQSIRVPRNLYGLVVPVGTLFLKRGILIATTKIDPYFSGKLLLRLYNTGVVSIFLTEGETIGSAIFFRTEATYEGSEVHRGPGTVQRKPGYPERSMRWLRNNARYIGTLVTTLVTSSVAALLISYCVSRSQDGGTKTPEPTVEKTSAPAVKPSQH